MTDDRWAREMAAALHIARLGLSVAVVAAWALHRLSAVGVDR